jgi:hypothetical protein
MNSGADSNTDGNASLVVDFDPLAVGDKISNELMAEIARRIKVGLPGTLTDGGTSVLFGSGFEASGDSGNNFEVRAGGGYVPLGAGLALQTDGVGGNFIIGTDGKVTIKGLRSYIIGMPVIGNGTVVFTIPESIERKVHFFRWRGDPFDSPEPLRVWYVSETVNTVTYQVAGATGSVALVAEIVVLEVDQYAAGSDS